MWLSSETPADLRYRPTIFNEEEITTVYLQIAFNWIKPSLSAIIPAQAEFRSTKKKQHRNKFARWCAPTYIDLDPPLAYISPKSLSGRYHACNAPLEVARNWTLGEIPEGVGRGGGVENTCWPPPGLISARAPLNGCRFGGVVISTLVCVVGGGAGRVISYS